MFFYLITTLHIYQSIITFNAVERPRNKLVPVTYYLHLAGLFLKHRYQFIHTVYD